MDVGIGISDLDLLTIGIVLDLWTEKGNDSAYADNTVYLASQDDYDRF